MNNRDKVIKESMYRIRVEKQYFNFSCAHFLLFNDGTREPLHGHNYWAWVEVEGELNQAGYLLDYITFKPIFRKLCDGLDHKTIYPKRAEELTIREEGDNVVVTHRDGSVFSSPKSDTLLLDVRNTSTELLATYLAKRLYGELIQRGEHQHLNAITVGVEEAPGQQGIFRYELPDTDKGANRGS